VTLEVDVKSVPLAQEEDRRDSDERQHDEKRRRRLDRDAVFHHRPDPENHGHNGDHYGGDEEEAREDDADPDHGGRSAHRARSGEAHAYHRKRKGRQQLRERVVGGAVETARREGPSEECAELSERERAIRASYIIFDDTNMM